VAIGVGLRFHFGIEGFLLQAAAPEGLSVALQTESIGGNFDLLQALVYDLLSDVRLFQIDAGDSGGEQLGLKRLRMAFAESSRVDQSSLGIATEAFRFDWADQGGGAFALFMAAAVEVGH